VAHLQKLLQQQDKGSGPAILSAFSQEVCALKHARFFIDIFLSQLSIRFAAVGGNHVVDTNSLNLKQELKC